MVSYGSLGPQPVRLSQMTWRDLAHPLFISSVKHGLICLNGGMPKMLQGYEEMNAQPYNIPWSCLTLGFAPGKCYQKTNFCTPRGYLALFLSPSTKPQAMVCFFVLIPYYSYNKTWHLDRIWFVIYSEVTHGTEVQCSSFPQ